MLAQPSPAVKPPDAGRVEPPEAAAKGRAASGAPALASADVQPAWGKPKDGVRIGILEAGAGRGANGTAQLSVALENVGKDDVVLNLGIMLANGKKQLPTAVRLTLTDVANKTRILHLHLKRPGIAGRVDPFVVPLPTGCRYTLPCVLHEYTDDDLAQRGVPVAPGRYRAKAEFLGEGVTRTNQDTTGLALMPYWTGTVASGDVSVTMPEQR
jgi:hypothetical protein